jgi:DNA-binding winged helix-turn-helix (wHTH) protein/predicted ATPase
MGQGQQMTFGPFALDMENERLLRGSTEVVLRPKSLSVLRYLVEHGDRLVTKEELIDTVWAGTAVTDTVLKVCVREIREALGDMAAAPQFIETVPRRGYRFIGQAIETMAQRARDRDLERFARVVGREGEVGKLTTWLAGAEEGERKIVFVTGEPGIGKTTLVDLFLQRARVHERMQVGRGQCLERYGEGEAYLPVLEAIGRLCRERVGERLTGLLRQYAPTWLVQMPALVQDTDLEALQRKVHGTTHERMLREITEAIEAFAVEYGLVLVLEDLQWSDYSTLELVSYLAYRRERVRLMVIGTYRPAEVALKKHPLQGIKQELHVHGKCEELALNLLTKDEVDEYVARRVAKQVRPAGLGRVVHRRTDGNALFMVNLMEFALAQGLLRAEPDTGSPRGNIAELERSVPDNLRQMVEKQVEELSGSARPLLEVASVAGRQFASAAVAAGMKWEAEEVEKQCDELAGRRHLLCKSDVEEWPDGTVSACYGFIHGFYQQVLYEQMGDAQRVRVHRSIGERKETGYGKRAAEIAGELALHFECGRDYSRAIQYHRQAAENGLRRRATQEAATHLRKGLELLGDVPDTPERSQTELVLQATLGRALLPLHGPAAPDVQRAYARAEELCQQVGDTPRLFPVLFGLMTSYQLQGKYQSSRQLGEQLLRAAERAQDASALPHAHLALGTVLFWCGELEQARSHLHESAAHSAPEDESAHVLLYPFDARIRSLCAVSLLLCVQGYPEQAAAKAATALTLAEETASPFDLASTRVFVALMNQFRRDAPETEAQAQAALTLSTDQGFAMGAAAARVLEGWALTERGELEIGMTRIRQGLDGWRATGTEMIRPYFLTLLAEANGKAGQPKRGLTVLAEALESMEGTQEVVTAAELTRVRGELLLQQSGLGGTGPTSRKSALRPEADAAGEAEVCFRDALDIARRQGAKLWELRVAMSLSRLWHAQGKRKHARELLENTTGWFREGFDTSDLREAKALLGRLSAKSK